MGIEDESSVTREELNKFLERQGVKGKDFAELVGVSATTMSRWRLGQNEMTRTSQLKVRQAMEATTNSPSQNWDRFLEESTTLTFPNPAVDKLAGRLSYDTMTFVFGYIRQRFPSDRLSADTYTTLIEHLTGATSYAEETDTVLVITNSLLRKDFVKFMIDEARLQGRLQIVSAAPASLETSTLTSP